MRYPVSRTVDAVENIAGLELPDPYRWLEEQSAEVREWQHAQACIAASCVRDWPHFAAVGELVRKYAADMWPSVPRFAGGLWFRVETPRGDAPQVVAASEPFGAGRVVVDLDRFAL
jgi:prolyl oligopeptidase